MAFLQQLVRGALDIEDQGLRGYSNLGNGYEALYSPEPAAPPEPAPQAPCAVGGQEDLLKALRHGDFTAAAGLGAASSAAGAGLGLLAPPSSNHPPLPLNHPHHGASAHHPQAALALHLHGAARHAAKQQQQQQAQPPSPLGLAPSLRRRASMAAPAAPAAMAGAASGGPFQQQQQQQQQPWSASEGGSTPAPSTMAAKRPHALVLPHASHAAVAARASALMATGGFSAAAAPAPAAAHAAAAIAATTTATASSSGTVTPVPTPAASSGYHFNPRVPRHSSQQLHSPLATAAATTPTTTAATEHQHQHQHQQQQQAPQSAQLLSSLLSAHASRRGGVAAHPGHHASSSSGAWSSASSSGGSSSAAALAAAAAAARCAAAAAAASSAYASHHAPHQQQPRTSYPHSLLGRGVGPGSAAAALGAGAHAAPPQPHPHLLLPHQQPHHRSAFDDLTDDEEDEDMLGNGGHGSHHALHAHAPSSHARHQEDPLLQQLKRQLARAAGADAEAAAAASAAAASAAAVAAASSAVAAGAAQSEAIAAAKAAAMSALSGRQAPEDEEPLWVFSRAGSGSGLFLEGVALPGSASGPSSSSSQQNSGENGGEVLADYEFGPQLGRGAYGVTRLVTCRRSAAPAACKSLSKARLGAGGPAAAAAMRREVAALRLLGGHDAVVALRRVYEDSRAVHLVMDLAAGGDMLAALRAQPGGKFPEAAAAAACGAVLRGLTYLHARGVAHRDVKPENWLLPEPLPRFGGGAAATPQAVAALAEGLSRAKAADFGASVLMSASSHTVAAAQSSGGGGASAGGGAAGTTEGGGGAHGPLREVVGTPCYMAPEVFARRGYDGAAADVWSAGVCLYLTLTGRLPFTGASDADVAAAVCGGAPAGAALAAALPAGSASAGAREVLAAMLDRDPARRPAAADLLRHPWIATRAGTLMVAEVEAEAAPAETPTTAPATGAVPTPTSAHAAAAAACVVGAHLSMGASSNRSTDSAMMS